MCPAKGLSLPCIICDHPALFLTEKNQYKIFRCENCGHGWVHPMPEAKTLEEFYQSEGAHHEQYDFPEKEIQKHAQRLTRWVMQVKPCPGIWLDIGSGRGVHLEVAREQGWAVVGVDASNQARQFAEVKKIPTFASLEQLEAAYPGKMFDVISFWETIEHLPNPGVFLETLRGKLKTEGILAFSTPNFGSFYAQENYAAWQELRPPLHLQYYTPQSLELVLKRNGYTVWNLITYGAWNAFLESWPRGMRLMKFGIYKLLKFYFDHTQQRHLKGMGILCMASLEKNGMLPPLRKFLYA